jgi:hypothetical protein
MGIVYRLLGLTAAIRNVLASLWLKGLIRGDWILFAIAVFYLVAGTTALGWPWPRLPWTMPLAYPALQTALAASALALLVVCGMRRGTIFRPTGRTGRASGPPVRVQPGLPEVRVFGRFERGVGRSVSLCDIPARWRVEDTGTISIEVHFDEGLVVSGMPFTVDSETWSLVVPRDALRAGGEEGLLYFGLSALPALRIRLPGRRMAAILAVRRPWTVAQLRELCDRLCAESVDREAGFFRAAPGSAPVPFVPTHPPEPAGPKNETEDGIPWNKLIDFREK